MGCVSTITFGTFPKQSSWLYKRTKVVFHYDTSNAIMGTIVRHDQEKPFCGIIRLDDGRYVLISECQHAPELDSRHELVNGSPTLPD